MRQALALVLMVVCVGVSAPEAKDKGSDLVGAYTVEGTNSEGKAYTGMALIERYDSRFKVQWAFPTEDGSLALAATGIGILHDGRLAIAIFQGGPPTIAVCDVKGDTLRCEWASVAAAGTMPESLKRLPKGQVPTVTPSANPHAKPQSHADEHAA